MLGEGFVIEGFVRQSRGCEPLEDVPVQVWLATETGGEQENRATVRTDADGRYRIETPPTVAQFGEPNIHVGIDRRPWASSRSSSAASGPTTAARSSTTLARR